MTLRHALVLLCTAGASLQAQGGGGGQEPPPDTARTSAPPPQAAVVKDSVKTRFPGSEVREADGPVILHWSRDEIFQTGAVNAAELIARIPGAGVLQTGFVLSPHVVTWMGETGRVRVFLDGIELDVLNPREGSIGDLASIAIWELGEVIAEASANELRVHLRTWRIEKTTPETRVDVLTGDLQTNLYRGYFGRRFQSGLGVQFGFEQVGTQQRDIGGDGDGLGLFGRLGWARGDWAMDLVAQRNRRSRRAINDSDISDVMPPYNGTETMAYVRLAFRNPETSSLWAQLIAARQGFKEESPFGVSGIVADSADTTAFRPQYIAAAGISRGGFRVSAAMRMRHTHEEDYFSPSVRAGFSRGRLSVNAFAEHGAHDSTLRADGGIRIGLLPNRVALTAEGGIRSPIGDDSTDATFIQGGLSVRLAHLWFSGGVIQRDSVLSAPPVIFGKPFVAAATPRTRGATFGVSGAIYKDFGLDVHGILWEDAGFYRPKTDIRGRVYLESDWRSRFPHGDFTIRASWIVDRRSEWIVPLESGAVTMVSAMPMTSILEIRIKSATLSWQFRNLFGVPYETVPGFAMPSRINLYGVRWTFTN